MHLTSAPESTVYMDGAAITHDDQRSKHERGYDDPSGPVITIGSDPYGRHRSDVQVDELAIWNYELDASVINALYQAYQRRG